MDKKLMDIKQIKSKIAPYHTPMDVNTAQWEYTHHYKQLQEIGDLAGMAVLRLDLYASVLLGADDGEEEMRVRQIMALTDNRSADHSFENIMDMVKDTYEDWKFIARVAFCMSVIRKIVDDYIETGITMLAMLDMMGGISQQELENKAKAFADKYIAVLSALPADDLGEVVRPLVDNAAKHGIESANNKNWVSTIGIYGWMLLMLPSLTGNPVCGEGFEYVKDNFMESK